MSDDLPILFIKNGGYKETYISAKTGSQPKKSKPSYGDRVKHANDLIQQLKQVNEESEGIVRINVNSPDYKNFPVEKLDKSGFKLLACRQTETGGARATVLLPNDKASSTLKKKFEEFRDKDSSKGNKPRNEDLVGRISGLEKAGYDWLFESESTLLPDDGRVRLEIWLDKEEDVSEQTSRFLRTCRELDIFAEANPLKFPEMLVFLACGDKAAYYALADREKSINKFRPTTEPSNFLLDSSPSEQTDWTKDLLQRVQPIDDSIAVCVLDSGCNLHPIIKPVINPDVHICVDEGETASDTCNGGHGTQMAGIAAYGNLNHVMHAQTSPVYPISVESCRIFGMRSEERLYGEVTQQGVYRVEVKNPDGTRVFCMALTSDYQSSRLGVPSSWSAAVDMLSAAELDNAAKSRLFILSAGNNEKWHSCSTEKSFDSVKNPAQAWNAITVGGSTHLVDVDNVGVKGSPRLFSPMGGLSPHTTNSALWQGKLPIKPDVLAEGGNLVLNQFNAYERRDELEYIAPDPDMLKEQYVSFAATSLSTAIVSHMAAEILRKYPTLRPETVRALIVHSAEWTQPMLDEYVASDSHSDYLNLARHCGHGVVDLPRAISCLKNRLTLVHEGTIKPYSCESTRVSYGEMVYHELPWPKEVLQELGSSKVRLKVTLSYFIEPNPILVEELQARDVYPSVRLRYSVRKSTDDATLHKKKINKHVRQDREKVKNINQYVGWQLGENAFLGSVHSDIWTGHADQLAAMGGIAIYPDNGWWKANKRLTRYDDIVHYSLVVSVLADGVDADIYTPVKNMVDALVTADVQM